MNGFWALLRNSSLLRLEWNLGVKGRAHGSSFYTQNLLRVANPVIKANMLWKLPLSTYCVEATHAVLEHPGKQT